jgi:hypothetical protein
MIAIRRHHDDNQINSQKLFKNKVWFHHYSCWRGRQQRRLAMVGVLANHDKQEKKLTASFKQLLTGSL